MFVGEHQLFYHSTVIVFGEESNSFKIYSTLLYD